MSGAVADGPAFLMILGGGLALDSEGNVVRDPVPKPGAPSYSPPAGGFPVNLDKIKSALEGAKKALPGMADPGFRTMLGRLGVPDDSIELLGKIGEIAGTLAKVVPYVAVAVDVLKLFGFFKDGPSALELLINQRFDELERALNNLARIDQARIIAEQKNKLSEATEEVGRAAQALRQPDPNPTAAEIRLQDARDAINKAIEATDTLTATETWLMPYNPDDYKWTRPSLDGKLKVVPQSDSLPAPVPIWERGAVRFDSQQMVYMVPYAANVLLTLLKAASPWYRSTGEYSDTLTRIAKRIEESLLGNMRTGVLARTLYTADDFGWGFSDTDVVLQPAPIFPTFRLGDMHTFATGAMDLCSYTDHFFQTPEVAAAAAGTPDDKRGALRLRWIPPAKLVRVPLPTFGGAFPDHEYRIQNKEECAEAANALAERDFADLFVTSPYLSLLHSATLLRHMATQPNRSETLAFDIWPRRKVVETKDTIARGRQRIAGTPISHGITCPAKLRTQGMRTVLFITTQPIIRQMSVRYRVLLRTLPCVKPGTDEWADPDYASAYHAAYIEDPPGSRAQRLQTTFSRERILGERVLVEGASQAEARAADDVKVELTATTFDWHALEPGTLPAGVSRPRWARTPGVVEEMHREAAARAQAFQRVNQLNAWGPLREELSWEDASKRDWQGRPRNLEARTVHLACSFRWEADSLVLHLENDPNDRNYVVFVVVEETLPEPPSPAWPPATILHTAIPVAVDGQVTFVTRDFYDAEEAPDNLVLDPGPARERPDGQGPPQPPPGEGGAAQHTVAETAVRSAGTFPVTFDATRLFCRYFLIPGVTPDWVDSRSPQTLLIAPGQYQFQIAADAPADFTFTVAPDGTVEYDGGCDAFLSGRGGPSLRLDGLEVTLDASVLTGAAHGGGVLLLMASLTNDDWIQRRTIRLLPQAGYRVQQGSGEICNLAFSLGRDGVLSYAPELDVSNGGPLQLAGGRTLVFKGHTVRVDSSGVSNTLLLLSVAGLPASTDAKTEAIVLPQDGFSLELDSGVTNLGFSIGATGTVTLKPGMEGLLEVVPGGGAGGPPTVRVLPH